MTLGDILDEAGFKIVNLSLDNLSKAGKVDTGGLYGSVKYVVNDVNNEPYLTFEMDTHGKYLDQGVSGRNKKRGKSKSEVWPGGTSKGYTNKMPPIKDLKGWCKRNLGDENLAYVISQHIWSEGIKATYWFTKAYNAGIKDMDKLIDDWIDELDLDEDEI